MRARVAASTPELDFEQVQQSLTAGLGTQDVGGADHDFTPIPRDECACKSRADRCDRRLTDLESMARESTEGGDDRGTAQLRLQGSHRVGDELEQPWMRTPVAQREQRGPHDGVARAAGRRSRGPGRRAAWASR